MTQDDCLASPHHFTYEATCYPGCRASSWRRFCSASSIAAWSSAAGLRRAGDGVAMISCISGATHATSGRGALCGAHVVRGAYDIGLRDWERIYASWGAVQSVSHLSARR